MPDQPALTSKNMNTTPVVDKPGSFNEDEIEARPLAMPTFTDIKHKNPMVALRWIKFGDSDVARQRFMEATYQGYVPVKPDEVVGPFTSHIRDGHIIYGDLICCKMDRRTYTAAKKDKNQRATDLVDKKVRNARGQHSLRSEAGSVNAPHSLLNKLTVFTPTDVELQALVGQDQQKK